MATKQAIINAFKFSDDPSVDRQFVGMTVGAWKNLGGATLRQEMVKLGYDDPGRLIAQDAGLLRIYAAEAQDVSQSITSTVNSMLADAVAQLPDGLSIEEAKSALQPFFQGVSDYNDQTLMPYLDRFARENARAAFYANNTSPRSGKPLSQVVSFDWVRGSGSDEPDECGDAENASPATYDELTGITGSPPPVRRNCACSLSAGDIDPADLPDASDLWTGADVGESAEDIAWILEAIEEYSGSVGDAVADTVTGPKVVAFDLDDSALQPKFMPFCRWLAEKTVADGGKIGVLTGNKTQVARDMFHGLYPQPAFYEVHDFDNHDDAKLPRWKAQMVKRHHVDVLVDDMRHGEFAEKLMKHLDGYPLVPLMPLLPRGAPLQAVESAILSMERSTRKYHVPEDQIGACLLAISEYLDPDEYDPGNTGQDIMSVYLDDWQGTLLKARLSGQNYVTLRVRTYGQGLTSFLEAKIPGAKFRAPSTGPSADVDVCLVVQELPTVADTLLALDPSPLHPCSLVMYRRYARQRDGNRITLDTDLRTDSGRVYSGGVLELKDESEPASYPAIEALDLAPLPPIFSKFTWSMGVEEG